MNFWIAATPRTGSTFLGQLIEAGTGKQSGEFINWYLPKNQAEVAKYIDNIQYVPKVMWDHARNLKKVHKPLYYRLLRQPAILLNRRDFLAQTVSYYTSAGIKKWYGNDLKVSIPYNFDKMIWIMTKILHSKEQWRKVLKTYYIIDFEDLFRLNGEPLKNAADFIGFDIDMDKVRPLIQVNPYPNVARQRLRENLEKDVERTAYGSPFTRE